MFSQDLLQRHACGIQCFCYLFLFPPQREIRSLESYLRPVSRSLGGFRRRLESANLSLSDRYLTFASHSTGSRFLLRSHSFEAVMFRLIGGGTGQGAFAESALAGSKSGRSPVREPPHI